EREPVRERRRDLHARRRCCPAVPVRGERRNGRRERADSGAGRVLLVRRLEELALRRPAHLRARGDPVLHAGQGRHPALAGPGDLEGRPRLPADALMVVGVALFDGAEELDWAGPWEVLAAWATQWADDGVRGFTLARSDGLVTCAKGLRVIPDETWETAPPLDVLVYPGGRGTRPQLRDEAVLDWIRGLA